MNDLSRFLEQQRSAGTVEQLDNVFTLSLEKGREKLSSYSLTSPEEYLLKVVQAAVVVGAKTLNIKLLRGAVLVYFELPSSQERIGVDRLSRALAAPLEAADRALAYLGLALCAAANESPKELMWGEWQSNEGGTILSLGRNSTEVFRKAPYPGTEPLEGGRTLYLLYLKKNLAELPFGQTAREHAAVTQRCCFAPLEILLDGRPLEPQIPAVFSPHDPLRNTTKPYFALLEIANSPGAALQFPVGSHGRNQQPKLPPELTPLSPGLPPVLQPRLPAGVPLPPNACFLFTRLVALPIYMFGPATAIYVKDGVCLTPIKVFDSGGGAVAILQGDHVHTDLTGFQPIRDEQVDEELEQVVQAWKDGMERVSIQRLPVIKNASTVTAEQAVISMAGCIVLGWLGLLAGPLYALYQKRNRVEQDPQALLEAELIQRRQRVAFSKKPLTPLTQSAHSNRTP